MLKHIAFGNGKKTLAILLPERDLIKKNILQHYIEPLEAIGVDRNEVVALSLQMPGKGKPPVKMMKPWLENLGKILKHEGIADVMICEPNYFKNLTKAPQVDRSYGYSLLTTWQGSNIHAYICPNYRALFYNPTLANKILFAIRTVSAARQGLSTVFDAAIVQRSRYPNSSVEAAKTLSLLMKEPELGCDIETYSLDIDKAGLGSIAFSTDEHSGVAFHVRDNVAIREHLQMFFQDYKGKLVFHGSTFDAKILIWELFMKHPRDFDGMVHGLHTLFRDLEDTKIISYLALNSTVGVSLSLKDLAFEFTGDYAEKDIKDITKIPPDKLLKYNLTDACATMWVKKNTKLSTKLDTVYREVFLPALKIITCMEICGVPINLGQVLEAQYKLEDISKLHMDAIMVHPKIVEAVQLLAEDEAIKANKKLKKLRKTANDFAGLVFNPNSGPQLGVLLHRVLDLPILATTDTGLPSTSEKTLSALRAHVQKSVKWGQDVEDLLEHIIELHDVAKILSTFLPAFIDNSIFSDGWHYLHGNFNLGGTKSGRLSSSDPNLTNLPSHGTQYAVTVKECFMPPPFPTPECPKGYLFVGADFDSLEDKVSALQTRDPNKLKIYTDGYDGHCLRAFKYFGDQMPLITNESVQMINSIEVHYPDLRQDSKSPTFLLTYMGTWKGLMKQFGFSKVEAKKIETDYHDLYAHSDKWVMDQIRVACKTGYVELAFGMELKTPMLPQIVIDSDTIPFQAHKEIKTAGNALGQSYGLLNTRAANEFMERVWDSKYATKVLPAMQIHDSQYYMIENTLGCLEWVNNNLIECMEWNELPAIQHPTIKLTAKLELYAPSWAEKVKLPNRATRRELNDILIKSGLRPPID